MDDVSQVPWYQHKPFLIGETVCQLIASMNLGMRNNKLIMRNCSAGVYLDHKCVENHKFKTTFRAAEV